MKNIYKEGQAWKQGKKGREKREGERGGIWGPLGEVVAYKQDGRKGRSHQSYLAVLLCLWDEPAGAISSEGPAMV